jgi:rubrerythrin
MMDGTLVGSVLAGMMSLAVGIPLIAANPQTMQNLQAAYGAESHAQARYLAFAEKADAEGYGAAASLFRAATRASQIHSTKLADVIRELGGIPHVDVQQVAVRSAKGNLAASVSRDEGRDIPYANFIKTAQREGVFAAVSTFEYAQKAQAQSIHLFADAQQHLERMRGGSRAYYVCSTSGFTVATLDPMYCMSGQYETVQ